MKEIKIGDWGWFWWDEPDTAMYGKILCINKFDKETPFESFDACFQNFSHEHPTGKFVVTENPNTVSNDPYADLKKAFKEGKTIQSRPRHRPFAWTNCTNPHWRSSKCYRIKPEPRYRPYTWEDREEFKDLWVTDELGTFESKIVSINESTICVNQTESFSYRNAYNELKKVIDGSPFGKSLTPSEDISNTN